MSRDSLERLVGAALALPQPPDAGPIVVAEVSPPRGSDRRRQGKKRPRPSREELSADAECGAGMLRRRVQELLAELARRLDASLPETLQHADTAWDQVDALRIVDAAVEREVDSLQRIAQRFAADEDATLSALGLEAQLTLDAALDLVSILERRLATLVRLQLRAGDHSALLPDGKPFLDLGAALHETARRWV